MKSKPGFNHILTAIGCAAFLLFSAVSCKDNPPKPVDPNPPVTQQYPDSLAGVLKVNFEHTVGTAPLIFAAQQYVSAAGDTFNITDLRYYISNVKLINSQTGKTFIEPKSYHLLNPKENKTTINLAGVPVKDYDQIMFSVGVDPQHNASTDQVGDLDQNNEMAWEWKTGYKFLIFGGNRISKISSKSFGLSFHVGNDANYKILSFPLNQTLHFEKNKPYTLLISANVNELFRSPNLIDFDVVNNFMGGADAAKIADNYAANMFRIKAISQ